MGYLEYLKKSKLGGYKIVDENDDWTHVAVEESDMNELLEEKQRMENKLEFIKQELEEAEKSNKKYLDNIREIRIDAKNEKENAERQLREARRLVSEAEEIREQQRAEIENIRRIYRETINAARGLKPKKQHTGYCVVSSSEKTYRYKGYYGGLKEEILWETILETPYTVDFKPDSIKQLFMDDLFSKDEDGYWKIVEIGINGKHFAEGDKTEGKYEELMSDSFWGKNEKYKENNIALEPQIKANYRTGYWEIIFYHTKALDYVPATWRKGNYR